MWVMPLHLHVNQKSDYDDDDPVQWFKFFFNMNSPSDDKVDTYQKPADLDLHCSQKRV